MSALDILNVVLVSVIVIVLIVATFLAFSGRWADRYWRDSDDDA